MCACVITYMAYRGLRWSCSFAALSSGFFVPSDASQLSLCHVSCTSRDSPTHVNPYHLADRLIRVLMSQYLPKLGFDHVPRSHFLVFFSYREMAGWPVALHMASPWCCVVCVCVCVRVCVCACVHTLVYAAVHGVRELRHFSGEILCCMWTCIVKAWTIRFTHKHTCACEDRSESRHCWSNIILNVIIYIHMHMCIHTNACPQAWCVCVCVCVSVWYVCKYVCVCVCVHTHTYTHISYRQQRKLTSSWVHA